jgi:hypothetical protein
MNIPLAYKLKFWIKNTMLSTATGAVVGMLIGFGILGAIPGAIIGLIAYQIIFRRYLWGNKSGDFQYQYRGELLEKQIQKSIKSHFGILTYLRYYMDRFNNIGFLQTEICNNLLKAKGIDSNKPILFAIYIKLASLALKDDDLAKEQKFLREAVRVFPYDLISNYRLAINLEKANLAEEAIQHYKTAMTDSVYRSDKLQSFLQEQIDRINIKGTMKKPPALGLRFSSW